MLKELGANHIGGGDFGFLVWAPLADKMELRLLSPEPRAIPMSKRPDGCFEAVAIGIGKGARYVYAIGGETERPDPASFYQPDGVHAPSETVAHDSFEWGDGKWRRPPLEDYIIYELHVGTFTPEGTFDAVAGRIPYLRELGVTALELMPVAHFPGSRNWGYDGVYPYAVQASYGGPEGLKRLVDKCHRNGLAVIMDVVYNHLGPEGNYLRDFGPYFTNRYATPWGDAVNFDGAYSDGVRRYFIDNALHWFRRYHIDAIRIDAIHGIFDLGAYHILKEIKDTVLREVGDGHALLIPESDLNDVRVITPPEEGGHGNDAQWNDDFHHALHTLLTGESTGYYMDFGGIDHMAKAVREGFVYSGQYSAFRKRRHGNSSNGRPPRQFVVFSQNHDQVGNRALGDRLSSSLSVEQLKLAVSMVVLSPGIPLIFMGEEYGETAPFQYFVSHSDKNLVEAVRRGRLQEFSAFGWKEVPDPQDERTFLDSKLDPALRTRGRHKELFDYYKAVIALRKELAGKLLCRREDIEVKTVPERHLLMAKVPGLFYAANFSDRAVEAPAPFDGQWRQLFDSGAAGSSGIASATIGDVIGLGPFGFALFGTLK